MRASKQRRVPSALIRPALWFCACNLLATALSAQCTNPTPVLTNQTVSSGTATYSDNNALTTNATINGSASITLFAGHCIELAPGFRATAGTAPTTFHAWVDSAPSGVSVSPTGGSGLTQQFTWTASSPAGYSYLTDIFTLFAGSVNGQNACYIRYNQQSNLLYLADNAGSTWLGGLVPQTTGTVSNSQCSINAATSSVTGAGAQLTLRVSVTFQPSFAGTRNDYLIAYDQAGLNTGWQQVGTWTVGTPTAPGQVSLVSPSNGATSQSTTPTLTWAAVSGATSYTLYLGTASSPPQYAAGITGTSFTPSPALASGTTYYWNVVAVNNVGSGPASSTWSFATATAPPAQVTLSAPANGATNQSTTPTLNWNAATGATSYTLYLGTSNPPPQYATGITAINYAVSTALTTGGTYYWDIVASNTAGSGPASAVWPFSTATSAPSQVTLTSPSNLAVNQSTAPTLTWTAASTATSYDVYLGTGNPPALAASVTGTSCTPSPALSGGTTYNWYVVAKNGAGSAPASATWSFTSAFTAVTLAAPSTGVTGQSTSRVLSWSTSTGATSYDVYLGTANPPPLSGNTTNTTYRAASALANGTVYYWKVVAKNSGGSAPDSAVRSFTTQVAAPTVATLSSPANGVAGQSVAPTLSWNPPSGATSYEVHLDTATPPGLAGTVSGPTYVPGAALAPGTTYYWSVLAKNAGGSSGMSAIWSFTTGIAAPSTVTLSSPQNGAASQPLLVPLSWAASTEATSYDVYLGTTNPPVFLRNTTATSYVAAIQPNTTYYWYVVAKDAAGSTASSIWSFSSVSSATMTTYLSKEYVRVGPRLLAVENALPPGPALTIAKTHSGNFTQGQTNVTYTVTVSNTAGAGPTSGTVNVADTLPSGLTLVSMAGTGWSCTNNLCSRADPLVGGTTYPQITVTANVLASSTSPQVNQVSVAGGGSASANASDSTVILQVPTLSITKTHGGTFTQGQTNATYTVAVANQAGASATSGQVTVTEIVPSGLTLVSMAGGGWSCGGTTCTRSDSLAGGSSYPSITVTVNVAGNATSPQNNQVTVSGGGSATASATDSTGINLNPPHLNVSEVHSGNFVQGQTNAVYTVTVSNSAGSGPTSGGVTLTDTPPAGMTVVSMSGSGWTCGVPTCWRSDQLAGSSSYPQITIQVSIASNAGSPLANQVMASGGGSGGASISDSARIAPALRISKTHTGNFIQGQTGVYSVTVSNPTALPTLGSFGTPVSLTDFLPTGLTLVSQSGTGWSCNGATCFRSDVLAAGGTYPPISITVNVANNAATPAINQIYIYEEGLTVGSAQDSANVVAPNVAPTWVSLNPNTGSGLSQAFTATFNDQNGGTDIKEMDLLIGNNPFSYSQACWLYYRRDLGYFMLSNDSGTGWLGPLYPGSGSVSNSYCTLNGAGSGTSVSGTTASITANLTFSQNNFSGLRYSYVYAADTANLNSGWNWAGSWTVPSPISVTMSPVGNVYLTVGHWQPFTATVTGTGDTALTWSISSPGFGSLVAPGGGTCTGSNCVYNAPASVSGPTWVYVTATSHADSSKSATAGVYVQPVDPSGLTLVSINPINGAGRRSTFQFVVNDGQGASNLYWIQPFFSATFPLNNGAAGCHILYYPGFNAIYLDSDGGGSYWVPGNTSIGGSDLSNSYCTVHGGTSSATPSGNSYFLNLDVEFKAPSFGAYRWDYLSAGNNSNITADWWYFGWWAVP